MKNVFSNNLEAVKAFSEGHGSCRNASGNIFAEGDILYDFGHHFPMAIRMNGIFLINGDKYSITTSTHQNICISELLPNVQIPFSALRGAMLEPEKIKIIHNEKDRYETVKYKDPKTGEPKTREVHHLGLVVFKSKSKFFLSGFDNQESFRLNSYFLTLLVKPAETVREAIEDLKPERVKQADKSGEVYKRQGEWFFIEQPQVKTSELKPIGKMDQIVEDSTHIATEVRENGMGKRLVRGTVRHRPENRVAQHGMLKLGRVWHEVVKNTALQSWQSLGMVD